MTVYFYTKNKDLLASLKQTNFEVSKDHKKLLKIIEAEQEYVLFFDYDANSKVYLNWLPKLYANPQVRLILYSEKLNLDSLKKIESQKVCADAHLKGPVDIDMLEEIAEEFLEEIAEGEDVTDTALEEDDTSNLDLDELGTEIRQAIVSHSSSDENPYECTTNNKIQEVFDHVFGTDGELGDVLDVEEGSSEEDEGFNLDDGLDLGEDDELSIEEELKEEVLEDDDSVIGFDVGDISDDTSSEQQNITDDNDIIEDKGEMSMAESTTEEDELSFGSDEGFDIEDDSAEVEKKVDTDIDNEDEGGLDFGDSDDDLDFGAESSDLEDDEVATSFVDETDSLDLGDDDGGALELGSDDPVEQEENTFVDEADSLDLGDDDGGDLDFGADDPVEQEENSFVDEADSLDLGDDDGGALELGSDEPAEAAENSFVDDSEGLDLGTSDDDDLEMDNGEDLTRKTQVVPQEEESKDVTSVSLDSAENTATKTLKTEISTDFLDDEEEAQVQDELSIGVTDLSVAAAEEIESAEDPTATSISMDDEETGQTAAIQLSEGTATSKTEVSGDDTLDAIDDDATGDFNIDEPVVEEEQPETFSYSDDPTASIINAEMPVSGDATDLIEASVDEGELSFSNESAQPAPAPSRPVSTASHEQVDIGVVKQNEQELLRLQATIKSLREDNQRLEQRADRLQSAIVEKDHAITNLKAENDELKIELNVSNRRHFDEIEEYKNQVRLFDKKKMFLEEKIKEFEERNFSLSNQARVDVNKIRQREKELENQLDLIKHDSEAQIQNRDKKILQLKRKIDTLEFNMENMSIAEKKSKEDLVKSDDKLHKLLKVLRHSLSAVEEEVISDEEIAQKINQLKN